MKKVRKFRLGAYKYTTESFKEIAKSKSPNIAIIGKFTKIDDFILCKCLKQDHHPLFTLEAQKIVYRGDGCPYCAGKRVCYEDSLEYNYPEVAKQWSYENNGLLKPKEVTCHSNKKVVWICSRGHVWNATISDRIHDASGCPYCTNKKILIGFNDLWTIEPSVARLLLHKENGYKATRQSVKRFDWVCQDCGNIIKNRCVCNIVSHGLSCNRCSDGFSYPSKFIFEALTQLNISFDTEVRFNWCKYIFKEKQKQGVYDFVFSKENQNYIIEVDGGFHYKENRLGVLSLSDIKFIDSEKDRLAYENNYTVIRIDCRNSDLDYIKDNVYKSLLSKLFNLSKINWALCNIAGTNSRIRKVYKMWCSGNYTVLDLANIYKISAQTVNRYIKLMSSSYSMEGA